MANHSYSSNYLNCDGLGRLVRTDRTTPGPTTTQFEHVRDGLKLVGNIDATNTNTAPTWTNKPGALRPVESQQVVTNSATQYINVVDEISPARRTYNPSTSAAGDTEAIAAKGFLEMHFRAFDEEASCAA